MDLYDESRTLVHSSDVARRMRTDTGFSEWADMNLALLDNYCGSFSNNVLLAIFMYISITATGRKTFRWLGQALSDLSGKFSPLSSSVPLIMLGI